MIEGVRDQPRHGRGHEMVAEVGGERLHGRRVGVARARASELAVFEVEPVLEVGGRRLSVRVHQRREARARARDRGWRHRARQGRRAADADARPDRRLLEAEVGRPARRDRRREVDDSGGRVGRYVREPARRAFVAVLCEPGARRARLDIARGLSRGHGERAGARLALADGARGSARLWHASGRGRTAAGVADAVAVKAKQVRARDRKRELGDRRRRVVLHADQRVVRSLVRALRGVLRDGFGAVVDGDQELAAGVEVDRRALREHGRDVGRERVDVGRASRSVAAVRRDRAVERSPGGVCVRAAHDSWSVS